jgi:membrane fusion protein (multidrug efflux system)
MRSFLFYPMFFSLLFTVGCHSEHHHEEEASVFHVTSPIKQDTSVTKDYVCQIHSFQHIEIRAQERGYLEEIAIDEGQYVHAGKHMFQIMPRLYSAEVQRAKAEADEANIEYQNTKALADSNIVSKNELALAKAHLDRAMAELSLAQTHLDFTDIRAPFDGYIDRFHVRIGSLLEEGELLTTLSDNSKMWVYFNMPEAEYLDYEQNVKSDSLIKVKLIMANNKMFDQPGVVETIEADFDAETGNIPFRATFNNPKGLLRHGETGNIVITVPLKNALLIPQKATFEVMDKKFVYVLDEDNVLQSRHITVAEMPHLFAVKSGLEEGDKILLEGLRKVKSGDKIEWEFQTPDKVLASLELYAE